METEITDTTLSDTLTRLTTELKKALNSATNAISETDTYRSDLEHLSTHPEDYKDWSKTDLAQRKSKLECLESLAKPREQLHIPGLYKCAKQVFTFLSEHKEVKVEYFRTALEHFEFLLNFNEAAELVRSAVIHIHIIESRIVASCGVGQSIPCKETFYYRKLGNKHPQQTMLYNFFKSWLQHFPTWPDYDEDVPESAEKVRAFTGLMHSYGTEGGLGRMYKNQYSDAAMNELLELLKLCDWDHRYVHAGPYTDYVEVKLPKLKVDYTLI